jgi:hypothetical protein
MEPDENRDDLIAQHDDVDGIKRLIEEGLSLRRAMFIRDINLRSTTHEVSKYLEEHFYATKCRVLVLPNGNEDYYDTEARELMDNGFKIRGVSADLLMDRCSDKLVWRFLFENDGVNIHPPTNIINSLVKRNNVILINSIVDALTEEQRKMWFIISYGVKHLIMIKVFAEKGYAMKDVSNDDKLKLKRHLGMENKNWTVTGIWGGTLGDETLVKIVVETRDGKEHVLDLSGNEKGLTVEGKYLSKESLVQEFIMNEYLLKLLYPQ